MNSLIYETAFSKLNDLVYLLDKDGSLVDCNYHLLRFLGFNSIEDKSIGAIYEMMRRQGLWTSLQIERFQRHDIDVLMTGKPKMEEQTLIHSDGSILYFEYQRTPLTDDSGRPLGLMVSVRDITKQKQLTEKLKNTKEQLRYSNKIAEISETNTDVTRLKVLLIEDNVIAQKAEKTVLMACRCLTDVVATTKQADEIFSPGKYDLVLMDLTLEEGDGYQSTALLRRKEQNSHFRVPIIALTGHDPTIVGFNCEDAEMDGILRKPLTIEQAKQLIQRYIRHADVDVKGLREFKQ